MDWQPKDTLPRDGTKFLALPWTGEDDIQTTWWIDGDGRWANWPWSADPDWWMLVPRLPK